MGGKPLSIETGKLAKQADGAVVVRSADTVVLATAQGRTEAREGADFADLADKNSALKAKNGGEMGGWQRETPSTPDSRKPLFKLKPGEVSDPVPGATGYFIYKVDEEQTAADGVREVKGRQILIEAKLPDDEREKIIAKAKELSDKAKAAGKGLARKGSKRKEKEKGGEGEEKEKRRDEQETRGEERREKREERGERIREKREEREERRERGGGEGRERRGRREIREREEREEREKRER